MQQEQSTENIIEELISECKIYRFASELQMCEDENRKSQLRPIVAILQRCAPSVFEQKEKSTEQKLDAMFDKEELFALKKSWGKLSDTQKKGRIVQYVSNMIMDDNKKEQYKKKILDLYDIKKLKKTSVTYDEKLGEISNIDVDVDN